MKVELLHYTPLTVCSRAIRTCWDSHDRSDNGGPKDLELIDKVGNKHNHSSTLEHLTYSFRIVGISRAVLQELARHRIASLSVKSTRYTLKELKNEDPVMGSPYLVEKYCVMTDDQRVNSQITFTLSNLQNLLKDGISNDKAKYAIPEAYRTELVWTINARSLQNFLCLRTSISALEEIRTLAYRVFDALPNDHKYLFFDNVK